MDTTFDRDSLKIFTSFHIFTSGKRKMGLFWTESVLIFKIRKREPLFPLSIWKLLVVADLKMVHFGPVGYCFKSTTE